MRTLSGEELNIATRHYGLVAETARRALCARDKCGAVIAKGEVVLGTGYNAPPGDDVGSAKCACEYPESPIKKKADKTCCLHAEWRAILDGLKKGNDLSGSTLYFARVDDDGNLKPSGQPYCTVCSRLALDVGIAEFVLQHEDGIVAYETKEYNDLSYKFHQ